MASEIRVNRLSNRSGLSTITFANGGVQFSGITTFANGEFYVGTGATIINPGTNEFNFHTGGSNRFTINNSGANLGTGNITAVDGTFTGNVSIAKTLTYEDVKNVDSVGVVTARTGVKVTGGDFTVGTAITASSVTGNVTQDVGITTFSGSAVWFKGATANKDMYWSHSSGATVYKDNAQILMGDGSDLQIYHTGSESRIIDTGTGDLKIGGSTNVTIVNGANNSIKALFGDTSVDLYYSGSKKFETTNTGISITGNISMPSGNFYTSDSRKLMIGTSDDLQLFHNGTDSFIHNATGDLVIKADSFKVRNGAESEKLIDAYANGAVNLYYDNTKRFETTNSGITVTGNYATTGWIDIDSDSSKFRCGDGQDLEIWHDGSGSQINNSTGYLVIQSDDLRLRDKANGHPYLKAVADGAVELYWDNAKKFETYQYGIKTTQNIMIGTHAYLEDGGEAIFGDGSDLKIYHDGSSNIIRGMTAGQDVYLQSMRDLYIKAGDNAGGYHTSIYCDNNGGVRLSYDNSPRLRTTNNGVTLGTGGGRFVIDGNATGGTARINMTRSDHSWGIHNETNFRIYSSSGNTETPSNIRFEITSGGTTDLYYNTTKKFATSNEGVSVTGRATFAGGTSAETQSVYLSAASNNPTQIGMFNGYGNKQGFCFYNNGSGAYTSWGMISDQQNLSFKTAAYNIGNTSDLSSNWTERFTIKNSGDVSFGISPNDTLWDSNNNEQGVYYRQAQGSFAMATRSSTGYSNWYMNKNTTGGNSDNRYIDFYWNNQTRGSITNSGGSSTSYNTSSDYRLKENIVDITDGITRLKQLKPRRFNWIDDSTNTLQDGFIAHEVSSFIPEAVTGTKDRVVTQAEVDADTQPQNDAAGTPVYQQMDYAKVTPLLTAALQELIAKVETLEAKVTALESS